MRSSRLSTPLSGQSKDLLSINNETTVTQAHASSPPEWQEPQLRPPAPSFEDYKGLERHGVLEYMQPLGTFPTQRVKLRLKQHDPPKRTMHAKNGEQAVHRAGTEDMSTPDPVPLPPPRRSKSRKVEDEASRPSSSRVQTEDSEYKPNGVPVTTPSKAASAQSPQHGTPTSRASMAHGKLSEVVESAVKKSDEMGDLSLGRALRKLHDESEKNLELSVLLHAVLQQKPTPQQSADFQSYVKRARKEVRAEQKSSKQSGPTQRPSSELKSMSPLHSARTDASKPKGTGDGSVPSNDQDNKRPTNHLLSPAKSTRNNAKSFSSDASSLNQKPSINREKRSSSSSSLSSVASSLSSVDPNLALKTEEDFASSTSPLPPLTATNKRGRSKASAGPKMGTFSSSNKRSIADIQLCKEDEELEAKRRKLTKTFPDYVVEDSHVRTHMRKSVEYGPTQIPSPPALQHPGQQALRLRNGTDRLGADDDSDDLDSPTTSVQSELLVPPPPFAGSSRRGATPTNLGRPPKAGKKCARVKMSPLKKKNGVIAGMPRPGGGRHSPIGSNIADGEGVNSDECSACGGTGKLLCCDGCTRSYHFTCVDPPQEKVPDGEWFCHACAPQPVVTQDRGLFIPAKNSLQRRKPVSFNLPSAIQDFYEDVVRGDDGEYEEAGALSKAKTRNGYDVPLDTLRLRDGKDNLILCYKCNKSALGNREIADCDFCNLHWHLDCLDPPLASAPKRFGKGTWRCPAHVDSEITLPRSSSGKTYKVRRPKHPRVIVSALRRGIKNNGNIEIDDVSSEEEEQPPGSIFRIPAMAIKLDFITQVKKSNIEAAQKRKRDEESLNAGKRRKLQDVAGAEDLARPKALPHAGGQDRHDVLNAFTAAERQAALSLAQFARLDPSSHLSGDRIGQLVGALTAEAPTTTMLNGYSAPIPNDSTGMTRDPSMCAKVTVANKGVYAANQASAVRMNPAPSESSGHMTEPDELAEYLRLEAAIKAKIAALRNTTTATATTVST
ncbi:MAG: hypothetical protein Q9170_000932 [Blastenia crenularia]